MNEPQTERRWIFAAPAALLALFACAFLVVNLKGFVRFCDADMQADIQVAKLMRDQGTLFPSGWIFGNQVYVAATPVLCALLMHVVPSPNLAMGLATSTMGALVLFSLFYMIRPFTGRISRLSALLALCGGVACSSIAVSRMGQLLFVMASYYACYAVTAFLVWGLWARLRFVDRSRGVALLTPLALALSFAMGMQSLRQTQAMVLPLLCLEGLWLLKDLVRERRVMRLKPLVFTVLVTAANVLGLIAIRAIAPEQQTIFDSFPTDFTVPLAGRLQSFGSAFLDAAGLAADGVRTPLPVFIPALALLLLTAGDLLLQWLRPRGGNGRALRALQGLCLLAVGSVLPVTFLSSFVMRSTYLFMYYPLAALCACDLLERSGARWRPLAAGALCAICLANFASGVLPCVVESFNPERTDPMRVADWMAENDYDTLYGYWWDVGRVAAAADGRIEGGGWFARPLQVQPYLTLTDIYGADYNDWAVYMLREEESAEFFSFAGEMGATLTPQAEIGKFTLYTSDMPLMYYADR